MCCFYTFVVAIRKLKKVNKRIQARQVVNSYSILAGILIIFESILILKGHWVGDFWEHSAVVKELSNNLTHPNNPIIGGHIPHAFISPYSILVALFSKLTALNSIQSLECFAFFNLLFLLWSIYFFCKAVFKEYYISIATLSLVLILFFWGSNPHNWSGFIHFNALHSVLPYPSTFSVGLVFLTLALVAKQHAKNFSWQSILIIVLSASVFIIHPTTAIFLYIGIIAWHFTQSNYSMKQCVIQSAVVIIPSLVLCLLWPYYNIIDLLSGNNADFHNDSLILYRDILKTNWPFFFVLPALLFVRKNKLIGFFVLTILLMILVYAYGHFSRHFGLSRMISYIMIFAHILIAYLAFFLLKEQQKMGKLYLGGLMIAFLFSIYLNVGTVWKDAVMRISQKKDIGYYDKFNFLRQTVESNDIVLANQNANWLIPSFNGKVLSSFHPLYFIDDLIPRRVAVDSFFNIENTDSFRQTVLDRYHPDYVLIDHSNEQIKTSTALWLREIGQEVYKKNKLELIKF